ncbi:MAG: endonuclease MutS2 [Christensenellales bacterium]|jgi:DNA mismatch repair protein MutS2
MRELKTLEFDAVRAMLAELAASTMGKALCASLTPAYDFDKVMRLQQETGDAVAMLYKSGYSPVSDFPDVRNILSRGKLASVLSMGELLKIRRCMKIAREVRRYFAEGEGILYHLSAALALYPDIEERIYNSILSEEEMADSASAALADIRRKIRRAHERVRDKLNSMIHSPAYQKYLQEPIITLRNGRFVIPVRQEARQSVPGMLHDQSASGSTLFIEPMAVVEINNELKLLIAAEEAEIERILTEITNMIAPVAQELADNLHILAELDLIFAKAQYAKSRRCSEPSMNEDGVIDLKGACHPLIPLDEVVPIDVAFGGETIRGLLITGPNTGGKTVTLKTIGLLTLMAQAGMQVPAKLGSKLAVFGRVFADIGDEQSIEQSLSTFSSHMSNLVEIIDGADENALVLLDELGAGTDPTEGAALAMAILDELMQRRTTLAATTHYSELKEYALTKDHIENASMEFDIETLRPTFRLMMGIPGYSNAFEISRRLGLDSMIIERAKEYVSMDDARFEEALRNAQQQQMAAQTAMEQAQVLRQESEQALRDSKARAQAVEQQYRALLEKGKQEAKETMDKASREARSILYDMKELAKKGTGREKAGQLARELDRKSLEYAPKLVGVEDTSQPPDTLDKGQSVRILSVDAEGTVLTRPDEKGDLFVQAGALKMGVNIRDLRLTKKKKPQSAPAKSQYSFRLEAVPQELHVRMQTLDEALLNIDRYLDDAVRSGHTQVRIVHGKGTGVLRNGVQSFLKNHPHVKSYRLGRYGEGEDGVTIVDLR